MKRAAFRAPGRVNLIGEHTDYNGGFVLPAAIHLGTIAEASLRSDEQLVIHSANFSETYAFDCADVTPRGNWTDYPRGVYLQLRLAGVKLKGVHVSINGDVPLGAGLSSSASVEVAVAAALLDVAGEQMEPMALALLCQRAENEFTGAQCGIMDQFISVHGAEGSAVLLDCESLKHKVTPIPAGLILVIANTMVKHKLAGKGRGGIVASKHSPPPQVRFADENLGTSGEYNLRRSECEMAARQMDVPSLRHATLALLQANEPKLSTAEFRRARHNITENARVLQFADAAAAEDLRTLGELMAASHASLRDDFEVSCSELDAMVEAAQGLPGLVGARMTGGGFGGSTINLVDSAKAEEFSIALRHAYERRTGIAPQVIVTRASQGVQACLI